MRTHKLIILSLILSAVILSVLIMQDTKTKPAYSPENKFSKVCFKENCFFVEIAETQEEKATGLMYRSSLDTDKGMFFIYESPRRPGFWMKNTLIPLDILWISEDGKVVHITTAQPCKQEDCEIFYPDKEALYVLEINAGLSELLNIRIGDSANYIPKPPFPVPYIQGQFLKNWNIDFFVLFP